MRSEDRDQRHHESVLTILPDIVASNAQDIPRYGSDSQTFDWRSMSGIGERVG